MHSLNQASKITSLPEASELLKDIQNSVSFTPTDPEFPTELL